MNIGVKIRFLLLILGICCIVTALSLKHSITKKDLLQHEASKLQENLSVNEHIVADFLADMQQLERAKQFHMNESLGLSFIEAYRPKGIKLFTYDQSVLKFWSSYKTIPPDPDKIAEGSSFIQQPNGWYEVVKKSYGNYTLIFLIDVKNQFSIQNRYLKNGIVDHLSSKNSLVLASFMDEEIYGITNLDGKLLFEVKLNPAYTQSVYADLQIWLWAIGLFCFALFINSFCAWLVKKDSLLPATLLLISFFLRRKIFQIEKQAFLIYLN